MGGSFVNHVLSDSKQITPEVGMGVTICLWSDRHAGTIVKVTKTQVHVQQDKATRVDKNGQSEVQEYTYERDTSAPIEVFRKNKRGQYVATGGGAKLLIGKRQEYYDPTF